MQSITSAGTSEGWSKSKKIVLNVFNKFLEECVKQDLAIGKVPFKKMTHKILCNRQMWEWFAGFLAKTYVKSGRGKNKNTNEKLHMNTVRNYFSTMMNAAKNHCIRNESKTSTGVRPQTKLFFSCLDKGVNEECKWFQGVKKNIVRFLFQQTYKKGETIDHSVQPVYGKQVIDA